HGGHRRRDDHHRPRGREAEAHRLARPGEGRDRPDALERGPRGEAADGPRTALQRLPAGDDPEGRGGPSPRPMTVSPLAGKPAPASILVDVPRLVTAYYTGRPDPLRPAERVAFGTSGHRGSSLDNAFNEGHILAITQAICDYRKQKEIGGPLFLGIDTHALSAPAFASALEVLAANGVTV